MYSAATYKRDIKINCCSSYFLMLSSLSILLKQKMEYRSTHDQIHCINILFKIKVESKPEPMYHKMNSACLKGNLEIFNP